MIHQTVRGSVSKEEGMEVREAPALEHRLYTNK